MDKGILKRFAIESRKDLMKIIENQLKMYFVDEDFEKIQTGDLVILKNDKHSLSPITIDTYDKRNYLISRIHDLEIDGDFEKGKQQVIEEVAYTWFNRIIAIRYMELNDMLPLTKDNQSLGIRVLSSKDNTPIPEIMKRNNLTNSLLDIDIIIKEYDKIDKEKDKFNYILRKICEKLGKIIPQIFDGNTGYIDILIPNNLLQENGFINKLVTEIPEKNFKEGVEVIGWLYQYYNTEAKDKAMAQNMAYEKNEIPYVTQLFTPDWIVKYMVENSLGRYWIEHNGDEELENNWRYFIKNNIEKNNKKVKPEEIKFIDPCCGSGHILVYAFEVLYQLYLKAGYSKKDIPELILKNNLYGLDIDERAGQLSILSVILKAREYDSNIFNKDVIQKLNVMTINETNNIKVDSLFLIRQYISEKFYEMSEKLYNTFQDAKEIGSLLIIEDKGDFSKLKNEIQNLKNKELDIFEQGQYKELKKFTKIIDVACILNQEYDIVVTNPPYLNADSMNLKLKKYIRKNYFNYKQDLYAAFMGFKKVKNDGYFGMINQHGWMFLTTFEKTRVDFLHNYSIINLIHLGPRTFEDIGGEVVQNSSFIAQKCKKHLKGNYIRLIDYQNHILKEKKYLEAIKNNEFFSVENDFSSIPGSPIAYWVDDKIRENFTNGVLLGDYLPVKKGMDTGNNSKFLRFWYEVDYEKTIMKNNDKKAKWVCYNKGGEFRKWYGNNYYVINWENNGEQVKKSTANIRSENLYFKPSITWTALGSCTFRLSYPLSIFDSSGSSMFPNENDMYSILAFCNSKVMNIFLDILNPTLSSGAGTIAKLPILKNTLNNKEIKEIAEENVKLVKKDWDNTEISWDFKKNPIMTYGNIKQNIDNYIKNVEDDIKKLSDNEKFINDYYINSYEIQTDNIIRKFEDKISIKNKTELELIEQLISYAVGCMFGRYSLDQEGLVCTRNEIDISKYKTFNADNDNIILITEESYFGDDIVGKFRKFIEIAFGKENLEENLSFIAQVLGKRNNENSENTIRRYFLNNFYKNHLKTYQKRPIYWLFDSGKNNGFKALIYMHRYNENTVGRIRNDYLYKVQRIYETRLEDIKRNLNNPLGLSTYEVRNMEKEQQQLIAKIEEIKIYNEKLSSVGDKKIKIDLDDGVSVNYSKFNYIDPITKKVSSILANAKDIIPKKKE